MVTLDPLVALLTVRQGYLFPVLGRPNLKVLVEAQVNRIVTSKENGELVARAVEFEHGGRKYSVRAKREVLLCTG